MASMVAIFNCLSVQRVLNCGTAGPCYRGNRHWFKYDGCQKLSIKDSTQIHHVAGGQRNYYLGCDALDCCYGDFSMKQWDISTSRTSAVSFVGLEDTTELNDNPVSQAEHWHEEDKIPFTPYKVEYDHFISRLDNGDIITHRIDVTSSDGLFPPQNVLYSDFKVQHDVDAFIQQEFRIPEICLKDNLLYGGDDQIARMEATYFSPHKPTVVV
jgi:hypothetical protein